MFLKFAVMFFLQLSTLLKNSSSENQNSMETIEVVENNEYLGNFLNVLLYKYTSIFY